jgi:hypothetical protein
MSGDGTGQLNLTGDAATDHRYPHFSQQGDHLFYLSGSVLTVVDREGLEAPQALFDLGEVSNFDVAAAYPPEVCGEMVDGFDYMGYESSQCAEHGDAVTVTSDAELAAYHSDFGYDPVSGTIKNLVVAYNPSGAVEIHSPCHIDLAGAGGYFAIDAERIRVFGGKGVWVAQGYASAGPSLTAAGEIVLVSQEEHARVFQGMTINANRICVQAGKKAEIGKDSLVQTEGAVELVGTRGIGSSDALIDQGTEIYAGTLHMEAFTQALIAKDSFIDAGTVLLLATGDIGATNAVLRQGVEVLADVMSMLSENKVTIDKDVNVTVQGHLEIDAQGRCKIDRRATIVAGSTSGSCLE